MDAISSPVRFALLALLTLAVNHSAHAQPGDQTLARLTSQPTAKPHAASPLAAGYKAIAAEAKRFALPGGSTLFVDKGTELQQDSDHQLTLVSGAVFVALHGKDKQPLVIKTTRGEIRGLDSSFSVRAAPNGPSIAVARGQVRVTGLEQPLVAGQQLDGDSGKPVAARRLSHLLDWTRPLLSAGEAPLVPGSDHAGGALIAVDPNGQEAKLELRKFAVDVYIEDGFARTTIDQTYFNHDPWQMEGTFYFPLPPDASLSRLAMYVNGELMEGGMAERDHARVVYESIRYMQRDPALLEWVDGSTFKMRVFPIEGRQEKRILLSYTQKLPSLYGQMTYRFPAGHSLQMVGAASFRTQVKNGASMKWTSSTHELMEQKTADDLILTTAAKNAKTDRDIELSLTPTQAPPDDETRFYATVHEGQQYLMFRYNSPLSPVLRGEGPGVRGQANQPKHYTFLIETSGDRDPLLARVQIDVLRHFLTYVEPNDTFNVLTANTRTRPFTKEPLLATPENIDSAIRFLEGAHLIGALDVGQAFQPDRFTVRQPVQSQAGKPDLRYLIHLGSGIAAMGERRDDVLANLIPKDVHYIGVGVGKRWNRTLMKAAAERTGGYVTQINPDEAVAWRAFELFATLNTPRLLAVQAFDQAAQHRFLLFDQAIAQGEEICGITRIAAGADFPKAVIVQGTLAGKPFERTLPVQNIREQADYLPRMWARLEIDRLLIVDPVKNKDDIIALSKAMYVMSPYTSLLVLENEDMYKQYNVDRGRKDHWAMYAAPAKIAVVHEPLEGAKGKAGERRTAKVVMGTVTVRETPSMMRSATSENYFEDVLTMVQGTTMGSLMVGAGPPPAINWSDSQTFIPAPNLREHARAFTYYGRWSKLSAVDASGSMLNLQNDALRVLGYRPAIAASRPNSESSIAPFGSQYQLAGTFFGRSGAVRNELQIAQEQRLVSVKITEGLRDFPPAHLPPQLLNTSEGLRQIKDEWNRAWITDSPIHLTPIRVHGGIGPGDERPRSNFSGDDRLFTDLIAYTSGMHNSSADIDNILETESLEALRIKNGSIDPQAAKLFHHAQGTDWQRWTAPGKDSVSIVFTGAGRYSYEHTSALGIREQVICDGNTLQHLYPQLHIGGKRQVSRFHRADFAAMVPWFVPPVEDFARGADVKLVGERTIAIVPHREKKTDKDQWLQLHLVFVAAGPLAERQLVQMPENKILARLVCSSTGTVRLLDDKGKEVSRIDGKLEPAAAPKLVVAAKDMVVLPLPFRSSEHVKQALKIENKSVEQLTFAEGLPVFAAEFAAGNSAEAYKVFRTVFHQREQRSLGFYVLLAACGQNLDSENADVLAEHLDEPLAQYLALHSSPVLRKHASQWAVSSQKWNAPFLQHLATTHALYQRWQSDKVVQGDAAKVQAELQRALDYVQQNKDSLFGWAMLCLIAEQAGKNADIHRASADAWLLFEKMPGLSYAARYEHARSLFKSGQGDKARAAFVKLFDEVFNADRLPSIDADFRAALLVKGDVVDVWNELMERSARELIAKKADDAVLALAWQCWQLEDKALANSLVDLLSKQDARATEVLLATLDFYWQTAQYPAADQLLDTLLRDGKLAERADLWRFGVKLAEQRSRKARALECLERALDLEQRHPPEVINLESLRADYGSQLRQYQNLADAMVTLKVEPPANFMSKVVRAADRWRAVDDDDTEACNSAAGILQTLGERELAWDYMTTPVGLKPNESAPWLELAGSLRTQGDFELAELSFKAAYESEPTNAQILWDRAENLAASGRTTQARALFRQIADGNWQPRFEGVRNQARLRVR